jgi:dynein heavy chain
LEAYLETKRTAFPRFYFLSNDELLEILANSQNIDVIQQHLKTCFDNVVKIDVSETSDITAMLSNEGEKVPFMGKIPKVKGAVEGWLATVQDAMRDTLKRLIKQGNIDYGNSERKNWVLSHFG